MESPPKFSWNLSGNLLSVFSDKDLFGPEPFLAICEGGRYFRDNFTKGVIGIGVTVLENLTTYPLLELLETRQVELLASKCFMDHWLIPVSKTADNKYDAIRIAISSAMDLISMAVLGAYISSSTNFRALAPIAQHILDVGDEFHLLCDPKVNSATDIPIEAGGMPRDWTERITHFRTAKHPKWRIGRLFWNWWNFSFSNEESKLHFRTF